jgi:hypothetical protein
MHTLWCPPTMVCKLATAYGRLRVVIQSGPIPATHERCPEGQHVNCGLAQNGQSIFMVIWQLTLSLVCGSSRADAAEYPNYFSDERIAAYAAMMDAHS